MALGRRAQRASGRGHYHYFEKRGDEVAWRSERIAACSWMSNPFGVLI